MATPNYKLTRLTCFFSYITAAAAFSLPPLLFMTFREMYGITYTMLGTLVLVNFCTQLGIDLIFSFFTKYFNIKLSTMAMPLLTTFGLGVYALSPILFPNNVYLGLLIGTVLFSFASGFGEVLISPIVAAIPSEHPDRDMSLLHSLYAWGVLSVVIISTIFFNLFDAKYWMYLAGFFALLPIITFILFAISPIPDLELGNKKTDSSSAKKRTVGLALCAACIFLGSAAENVMTNWISGYVERVLGVSKQYGDILGLALFALLLGAGRTIYAKIGKNITNTLLFGMISSVVCYLTAALCDIPVVAMLACILTGLCTSLLWPGTLILMEEKIVNPGVAAYALMAAGGDFGASVAPQLLGVIADKVTVSSFAQKMAESMSVSPDQIGLKAGMLITALFPLLGIAVILIIKRYFTKKT